MDELNDIHVITMRRDIPEDLWIDEIDDEELVLLALENQGSENN